MNQLLISSQSEWDLLQDKPEMYQIHLFQEIKSFPFIVVWDIGTSALSQLIYEKKAAPLFAIIYADDFKLPETMITTHNFGHGGKVSFVHNPVFDPINPKLSPKMKKHIEIVEKSRKDILDANRIPNVLDGKGTDDFKWNIMTQHKASLNQIVDKITPISFDKKWIQEKIEMIERYAHQHLDQDRYYLECMHCNGRGHLTPSLKVYSKDYGMLFVCDNYPACDAYVGVHSNSDNPKGLMADSAQRALKKEAHAEFDKLWKSGKMDRNKAYEIVSEQMGLPRNLCHIGMFDEELCQEIIQVCKSLIKGN